MEKEFFFLGFWKLKLRTCENHWCFPCIGQCNTVKCLWWYILQSDRLCFESQFLTSYKMPWTNDSRCLEFDSFYCQRIIINVNKELGQLNWVVSVKHLAQCLENEYDLPQHEPTDVFPAGLILDQFLSLSLPSDTWPYFNFSTAPDFHFWAIMFFKCSIAQFVYNVSTPRKLSQSPTFLLLLKCFPIFRFYL